MTGSRITAATVRDDFNSVEAIRHYTRAAESLGLWESERILIERFIPDRSSRILEAGCGAGRVTLGLWDLGYRNITAFDFAEELLAQARRLAAARGADSIHFLRADATQLQEHHPSCKPQPEALPYVPPAQCHLLSDTSLYAVYGQHDARLGFDGVFFAFNGLMQIPGRENRRAAMRQLHGLCRARAPFIFTTHDRDDSPAEADLWDRERAAWQTGDQVPNLVEFGDRYVERQEGRTFMHLPDQTEVREDLEATGWRLEFTSVRREIARETGAVREFSDECRFWVAIKPDGQP